MTERAGTSWLLAKALLFTIAVPGSVAGLFPYLLLDDPSLSSIDFLGLSLLGGLPIVLGAALYFRCVFDFVFTGRGTPAPIDPPTALVATGAYRYVRNPMYLGVLAIIAGEALIYRDLGLLYYLLAVAAAFVIFVFAHEEPYLRRQFGEGYRRYREQTPRFIPSRSGLTILYRESFLKVGALVLGAGALAHILRLSVGLPVAEMPDSVHAILVVLPAYAGIGCIAYARRIALPGITAKVIFALATGLLITTAVMHVFSIAMRDSQWLGMFPIWYSVLAVIVYGGLAHFLKARRVNGAREESP